MFRDEMVVLHHRGIVQSHAMIVAAPGADGRFLQHPPARRGLAGVEHLRPRIALGGAAHVLARLRCGERAEAPTHADALTQLAQLLRIELVIELGLTKVTEVLFGCVVGLVVSALMARVWPLPERDATAPDGSE